MKLKNIIISSAAVFSLLMTVSVLALAEGSGHKHGGSDTKMHGSDTKMMKGSHGKGEHGEMMHGKMGQCPMMLENTEVKIKNIKKGAVVTLTSDDPEMVKKIQEHARMLKKHKQTKVEGDEVTCPVMGTKIDKSQAVDKAEYKGKTYYFCCNGCKPAFMENPEKYVKQ